MSARSGLARLGIGGERSRRAQEGFGRASADLLVALKRALPFLARKRVGLTAEPPVSALFSELGAALPNMAFTMAFGAGAAGARGVLALDSAGLSRILDGVLGAGDAQATDLPGGPLSSAQAALAAHVSVGILGAFAGALRTQLGLVIETPSGACSPPDTGTCAVLSFAMEGGGVVALALPLSVLNESETIVPSDGTIAAAMVDVEIDVVAELGKVRVPLSALSALAVGDVLPLPLSLDDRARVCAGGAVLFRGRPTAIGLTIGIAIERHGT